MWRHRMALIDKARQMYMSTWSMLMALHYGLMTEEREIIVSKVKEESAIKLINDKIRNPWMRLPAWVREALPIDDKPAKVITCLNSGSTITAVAQNFAKSDARGITASLTIVDEAAYQEFFAAIYQAIQPMAGRMWAITTANIGNDGATTFKDLAFEGRPVVAEGGVRPVQEATDVTRYRDGLLAYTTPKGIRTFELDYWADPDHTPEWAAAQRKSYAADRDWRREMERDWTTPEGEIYFPAFIELGGRKAFVHLARKLIKGYVFRSFDFGRRRPAMTCFQYSQPSHRVWLMREFMPEELLAHEFLAACKFLCGECDWDDVPMRAQAWIDRYRNKISGLHCPPPWFPPGTPFFNIGGKEALQGTANAFTREEAVVADIFANGGVPLNIVSPRVLARNQLVGSLLRIRKDNFPGLFVDPQCELMIEGFSGKFCYPKATVDNPFPVDPKDDGHFINLLDAFGYGVAAVLADDAGAQPTVKKQVGWQKDGRTPKFLADEDAFTMGGV